MYGAQTHFGKSSTSAAPAAMATPAQRIVTVVHATGKQGSGVVHALLRSGQYRVKAVTRDATTDSARLPLY